MQAAMAVVGEVVQEVLEVVEPFQDWIDPYQDRLYNAVKDTAVIQAIQRDARERPKVLFVEEAWWILNGRARP
ncbi:MAG: hypothetical protein IPJ90_23350 [Anaerolineaceae bacterium]|nr:hypothetical protein [Anaerolineaceae bacterium]